MKRLPKGTAQPDPAATVKVPGGRGLPAHKPTAKSRARVRLLAGWGFSQPEIGVLIELGVSALQKHYAHELRVGALECEEMVVKRMAQIIQDGNDADAGRWGMFFMKVRRRWHEVQRIIHGYDPETIKSFVKGVVSILRRELPDACPGCKTKLNLPDKIAGQLLELSNQMAAKLPDSQVVATPRPELASDGLPDDAP